MKCYCVSVTFGDIFEERKKIPNVYKKHITILNYPTITIVYLRYCTMYMLAKLFFSSVNLHQCGRMANIWLSLYSHSHLWSYVEGVLTQLSVWLDMAVPLFWYKQKQKHWSLYYRLSNTVKSQEDTQAYQCK